MTIEDIVEWLGTTASTIRDLRVEDTGIPAHTVNGVTHYDRDALIKWAASLEPRWPEEVENPNVVKVIEQLRSMPTVENLERRILELEEAEAEATLERKIIGLEEAAAEGNVSCAYWNVLRGRTIEGERAELWIPTMHKCCEIVSYTHSFDGGVISFRVVAEESDTVHISGPILVPINSETVDRILTFLEKADETYAVAFAKFFLPPDVHKELYYKAFCEVACKHNWAYRFVSLENKFDLAPSPIEFDEDESILGADGKAWPVKELRSKSYALVDYHASKGRAVLKNLATGATIQVPLKTVTVKTIIDFVLRNGPDATERVASLWFPELQDDHMPIFMHHWFLAAAKAKYVGKYLKALSAHLDRGRTPRLRLMATTGEVVDGDAFASALFERHCVTSSRPPRFMPEMVIEHRFPGDAPEIRVFKHRTFMNDLLIWIENNDSENAKYLAESLFGITASRSHWGAAFRHSETFLAAKQRYHNKTISKTTSNPVKSSAESPKSIEISAQKDLRASAAPEREQTPENPSSKAEDAMRAADFSERDIADIRGVVADIWNIRSAAVQFEQNVSDMILDCELWKKPRTAESLHNILGQWKVSHFTDSPLRPDEDPAKCPRLVLRSENPTNRPYGFVRVNDDLLRVVRATDLHGINRKLPIWRRALGMDSGMKGATEYVACLYKIEADAKAEAKNAKVKTELPMMLETSIMIGASNARIHDLVEDIRNRIETIPDEAVREAERARAIAWFRQFSKCLEVQE